MNWRKLLPVVAVILAAAAIGVLAFLVRKTQTVDNALHLERLDRIRVVDALDVLARSVDAAPCVDSHLLLHQVAGLGGL